MALQLLQCARLDEWTLLDHLITCFPLFLYFIDKSSAQIIVNRVWNKQVLLGHRKIVYDNQGPRREFTVFWAYSAAQVLLYRHTFMYTILLFALFGPQWWRQCIVLHYSGRVCWYVIMTCCCCYLPSPTLWIDRCIRTISLHLSTKAIINNL